jgi:hypothetical protein
MYKTYRPALALVVALFAATTQAESDLDLVEQEGIERSEEGRAAQERIDAVSDNTRNLVDDFRAELKLVDGLEAYIGMLDVQLRGQEEEMNILQQSIADVAVIERQILPMMARMIDSLDSFIQLDVPFLTEERQSRVDKLRELLQRADVTVAEKARRVFEAYQIENDYGRTIEAYKDKLELAGGRYDADFLRIGRVALMYRTVGADNLGYWDATTQTWRELDAVPYRRLIDNGLKVARQEIAPELISIPLDPQKVETL